jgi:adenylate kinase family enzyme
VLILTGAPGAGKATLATHLATRRERSVQLEACRSFRFIDLGHVELRRTGSHQQNEVVVPIVADAGAAYANAA